MLFIDGILGEFIRPIPTTVMITLLLSFRFSIVFIPTVARVLFLCGPRKSNPIVRAEQALARRRGRFAGYPSGHGAKGVLVGTGLAPLAVDVLGDELDRSQNVRGNERTVETFIDLTPIDSRSTTAPEFVEEIEARVADVEGARVSVGITEHGPPVIEFPFAAQITVDDATVDAGQALAEGLRDDLIGRQIATGGTTVIITDAIVDTDGEVYRVDGQRVLEVRAQYDEDNGILGILNETEADVAGAFDDAALEAAGLPADALTFDFGAESDNQEDFAALGTAGLTSQRSRATPGFAPSGVARPDGERPVRRSRTQLPGMPPLVAESSGGRRPGTGLDDAPGALEDGADGERCADLGDEFDVLVDHGAEHRVDIHVGEGEFVADLDSVIEQIGPP